ncbi:MAG TPA: hypothetical protein VF129_11535 [Actinomycetota bacterium]
MPVTPRPGSLSPLISSGVGVGWTLDDPGVELSSTGGSTGAGSGVSEGAAVGAGGAEVVGVTPGTSVGDGDGSWVGS